MILLLSFFSNIALTVGAVIVFLVVATIALVISFYKKVPHGKSLVRTGMGGTKVAFSGMFVVPALHKAEVMDVSIRSLEIVRMGEQGLICRDNIRADIKVAFFVRVNNTIEDVTEVAQSIGCNRASNLDTLINLFDAKFSEALKTVGKQFDFVELYEAREKFRQQIINTIGTDLNGYHLDDAAIDYLEQTSLVHMKEDNILDAEGIRKITDLTAKQKILANQIRREEEKVITQQNTEAREKILELERQLRETEEKQARDVTEIEARERSQSSIVKEQERQKSEAARIEAEEQIERRQVNKEREIIVAQKAKERTEAIEQERVLKERDLEATERERVVELKRIEKEKALEEQRREIQGVIRERVKIERTVVEEQERIKDTSVHAEAERKRKVVVIEAEQTGEAERIVKVKVAEGEKQAAEHNASRRMIEAETQLKTSELEAQAKTKLAEATASEEAAMGMAKVQVMEAEADAIEKQGYAEAKVTRAQAEADEERGIREAKVSREKGQADADVIEQRMTAEARGTKAQAEAEKERGAAEAEVIKQKGAAEGESIKAKADAMKSLDDAGYSHEEYKLHLKQQLEIRLRELDVHGDIARAQAEIMAEALKNADIDIVGGDGAFFDKLVGAVGNGKAVDAMMDNSMNLQALRDNLFAGGGANVLSRIRELMEQGGISSNDIKNITVANLLLRLRRMTENEGDRSMLMELLGKAEITGMADRKASEFGL